MNSFKLPSWDDVMTMTAIVFVFVFCMSLVQCGKHANELCAEVTTLALEKGAGLPERCWLP